MTSATTKRLVAVLALLVAGSVLGFVSFSDMEKNLVYYWTPDELLEKGDAAKGATVRLGGVVLANSVDWDPDAMDLSFTAGISPGAAGPDNPSVRVRAHGAPPQMFREGIGVVVEGQYNGEMFMADRVMVKHSNEYRPPEEGEHPEGVPKTLLEE